MSAFNQIIKSIAGHDTAIDAARQEIIAIVGFPFLHSGHAHEQARQITKYVGIIYSRLHAQREAKRILGLLEYEAVSRNEKTRTNKKEKEK